MVCDPYFIADQAKASHKAVLQPCLPSPLPNITHAAVDCRGAFALTLEPDPTSHVWSGAFVVPDCVAWTWGCFGPGDENRTLSHDHQGVIEMDIWREENEHESRFRVVDMSIGDGHTLTLDQMGTVRSEEDNTHGQLGRAVPEDKAFGDVWGVVQTPGPRDGRNREILNVLCGGQSSLMLVKVDP